MTEIEHITPRRPVAPGELYEAEYKGRVRQLGYAGLSHDGEHHISALYDTRFTPPREVAVIHHADHDYFHPNGHLSLDADS